MSFQEAPSPAQSPAAADQSADTPDLLPFVENVGLVMESAGLPRAAGRILGWLLVSEPPEQTAADLVEALESSTGGVSQNLRMLTHFAFIERASRRGDRRTYYRVAPGAWEAVMNAQLADTTRFRELGEAGLSVLDGAPAGRRERLSEMTEFFRFLEQEVPAMMQRWAERKGDTHG